MAEFAQVFLTDLESAPLRPGLAAKDLFDGEQVELGNCFA